MAHGHKSGFIVSFMHFSSELLLLLSQPRLAYEATLWAYDRFLHEPMKYPCQEEAKNESFPLFLPFLEMTCNGLKTRPLQVEGKRADRLIKHPWELEARSGCCHVAHARSAEQAMPPGPTLDRSG